MVPAAAHPPMGPPLGVHAQLEQLKKFTVVLVGQSLSDAPGESQVQLHCAGGALSPLPPLVASNMIPETGHAPVHGGGLTPPAN